MIIIYLLLLSILLIYSYSLVDPNLTFINHPAWAWFRNNMVQLGYYHRDISALIYIILIILLSIIYYLLSKNYKKYNPVKIAIITIIVLLLSYPFLSHDFFNYMFDARIFTHYGQNPYLHKALDFPNDQWLRFMHWTHRNYPYGPVYLVLSFIPSWLGLGKFFPTFILFKLMNGGFYFGAVYFLNKLNKKWAMNFATQPLIIIEGLVNGHNDLIGLSLAVIGFYWILRRKNVLGRCLLILSVGIKYLTLPFVILGRNKYLNWFSLAGALIILGYLSLYNEVQPWYFLMLFVFLPINEVWLSKLNIFLTGLLLSYYPYIYLGGWADKQNVLLKHQIIMVGLGFNLLLISWVYWKKKFFTK